MTMSLARLKCIHAFFHAYFDRIRVLLKFPVLKKVYMYLFWIYIGLKFKKITYFPDD